MKKILTLFAALLIFSAAAFAQEDITAEGKVFRNAVKKFLTEEGFAPTIDEEYNSLDFKKEGASYWFYFFDSQPIYVRMFRGGTDCSGYTESVLLRAANQTNIKRRAVKCTVSDKKIVSFISEFYANSIEDFKYTFYSNMDALDGAKTMFSEKLDEYNGGGNDGSSSVPFTITSVLVGNIDYNSNIISDYGQSIYSSATQYFGFKIYITTYIEGDYDLYIKLFTPNLSLSTGDSSPSGYSFKRTLSLKKVVSSYQPSGWGSSSSGTWASGEYRIEFYYKDKLVFTKKFYVL
jgi:hypothetical protein